jgi:peptidoglycan/xylan/chitin deacetylase (PgdA/CDA1 family)
VDGPTGDRIPGLYLDWDGVRALEGWEIGSHTVHHPVLTSVSAEEAVAEIGCSSDRIRAETGRRVRTLAYPNGLPGDYGEGVAAAARSVGIDLAFTLHPGPARPREIRSAPMEIRRVYVGFGERLGVLGGKAMGATRLLGNDR